ncbi:FAD synthetase family protein [Bacillus sp. ISL-18]|uniref:FAD synthetase family protein n=1 Tax=Bacillus sp. ISL-18 TaxID=2819118 RepID=UPI001BE4E379|nr:FAD synthetase family protein [Bacillus sp. ISL-18]MBT2654989.1 FAD synthetase family protein [Bacillus sp. ISL-18]
MKTIHLNRDNLRTWQKQAEPNVMALGCFDGLHLGHCEVIIIAKEKAKEKNVQLAVMSFFPHPKSVLTNGKKQIQYLMPLTEKEEKLRGLGVDLFYVVEFDKEFSSLSPDQFVIQYLTQFAVIHAVAGFDFCYGSRGAGNMDRLNHDSGGKIDVTKVEKVAYRDEKISSSCIRERLLTGNVEELPHFMGSFYKVKCDWDGIELTPQPYYTLPAPGRYAVTLENEENSLKTEVMVLQRHDGPLLKCSIEMPPVWKGMLFIVWQSRVMEENVQTFEKKTLIS